MKDQGMSEMIERLRARGPFTLVNPDGPEAASLIESQQAMVGELLEALEGAVTKLERCATVGGNADWAVREMVQPYRSLLTRAKEKQDVP